MAGFFEFANFHDDQRRKGLVEGIGYINKLHNH